MTASSPHHPKPLRQISECSKKNISISVWQKSSGRDFNPAEGDTLDLHNLLSSFAGYDGTNAISAGYLNFVPINPETGDGVDIYVDSKGRNNSNHLIEEILNINMSDFLSAPISL